MERCDKRKERKKKKTEYRQRGEIVFGENIKGKWTKYSEKGDKKERHDEAQKER